MSIEYRVGGPAAADALPPRETGAAMWLGALGKCPNCGNGHLFSGYIKVAPTCDVCGEDFSHNRSDDLPAYLTIAIVGHLVVPGMIVLERGWHPETWVHLVLWLPLVLLLSFVLLRPIKGAVVGLQWANYMHGFDPRTRLDATTGETIR